MNLFLTIIAADYALTIGGYALVVLIALLIETSRKEGRPLRYFLLDLTGSKLWRSLLPTSVQSRTMGGVG